MHSSELFWILGGITALTVIVYVEFRLLLKRLDNADARIVRLESAMDAVFQGKKAMEPPDKVVKLRCKPDANCRKCHGRGHIGRNHASGLFIACVCCS